MGTRSRRAVPACLFAASAALYAGTASAQSAPYRTSLVSSFNPINPGGASNDFFADFGIEGNLVGLGTITGTGVMFIDITNPAAPVFRSHYNPARTASNSGGFFQDVAIRGNYAYCAVDDASSVNGGIHILDVTNPAAPVLKAYIQNANQGFHRNHTITLDGNYLYAASNRTPEVKVFNIANPEAPTHVRTIMTTFNAANDHLHDTFVRNGRLFTSNITTGLLEVYDVSNVAAAAPVIGSIPAASIGSRNHSSSVSEDGNLVAVARETSGGDVQLWNITNLASPTRYATITRPIAETHSAHNPVIVGDTLYVSWYHAGLQIYNIRNPSNPVRIGAFDTHPGTSGGYLGAYDGNWGVNTSLGPKKILLSDMDRGLFIVDACAALTFNWTLASDTNTWQTTANWDSGAAPMAPDGTDMIARFTTASAGTPRRVTINGGAGINPVRVGTIEFSADRSYTLAPVGTTNGRIEMNVTSGAAAINVLNTGGASTGINRIDADLELSDDLVVTNASTHSVSSLILQRIVATNKTITFKGVGRTLMEGTNAWTGSLVIDGGDVNGRQSRLGANTTPITIKNGGRLTFLPDGSPTTSILDPARVLHFESGVGRIEAMGDIAALTVIANTANQIRGAGNLSSVGFGTVQIGAANPNFTGNVTINHAVAGNTPLTGGTIDLHNAAGINQRPITLSGGVLALRNDTTTDYGSSLNTAGTVPSGIRVDRVASGTGQTMQLGAATNVAGHTINVTGANGYKLGLDSLTNAGTINTSVPLVISGPLAMNGGMIGGAGHVFADGGANVSADSARSGPGLLRITGALSIGAGVKLDITTSDLLVDYAPGGPSPEGDIRDLVIRGRDEGLGLTWTAGAGNVVLAIADNTEWQRTQFEGVPIDPSTIVGKYTYYGDANLDGKVTSDDYVAVDVGLGVGDSWIQGDFNFSGTVTSDDYVAVDVNLGMGTTTPLAFAALKAEMIALHAEMFGDEYLAKVAAAEANGFAPVPEPSGALLVGAAALTLARRKRRVTTPR